MTSAEVAEEFMRRIKSGDHYEVVQQNMDSQVRHVQEELEYDDHGNGHLTLIFSVALNDETRDIQFVQVARDVEGGSQWAWLVKPKAEVVVKYVVV